MDDCELSSLELFESDWICVKSGIFERKIDDTQGKCRFGKKAKDGQKATKLKFFCGWNPQRETLAVTAREGSRNSNSTRLDEGWTTELSLDQLRGFNQTVSLLDPTIEATFPLLPPSASAILFPFSNSAPPVDISEETKDRLEDYFEKVVDKIGFDVVLSILFRRDGDDEDDVSGDQYFESLCRHATTTLEKELQQLDERFQGIVWMRNAAVTMLEMKENVYNVEDDLLLQFDKVRTRLYTLQLQPFIQLREIAFGQLGAYKDVLDDPSIGPRLREEALKEISKWEKKHLDSLDSIQRLHQEFHSSMEVVLQLLCDRMANDLKAFGRMAFDVAAKPRYNHLQLSLAEETLQSAYAEMKMQQIKICCIKYDLATSCAKLTAEEGDRREVKFELESHFVEKMKKENITLMKLQEDALVKRQKVVQLKIKELKQEMQEKKEEEEEEFLDASEDVAEEEGEEEERKESSESKHLKRKMERHAEDLSAVTREIAKLRLKQKKSSAASSAVSSPSNSFPSNTSASNTSASASAVHRGRLASGQSGDANANTKAGTKSFIGAKSHIMDESKEKEIKAAKKKTMERLRKYKAKYENGSGGSPSSRLRPTK